MDSLVAPPRGQASTLTDADFLFVSAIIYAAGLSKGEQGSNASPAYTWNTPSDIETIVPLHDFNAFNIYHRRKVLTEAQRRLAATVSIGSSEHRVGNPLDVPG